MSAWLRMPPAAISGTLFSMPAERRKASACGMTFSKSKRGSARSAILAAPRWPPASRGCSMTMASGSRFLRSHLRTSNCTPRASDRMGTSSAPGWSCARSGRSSGRPAPTTTASMPHSSARVTEGAYSPTARITLMASRPRPPASWRAARISRVQRLEVGVVDDLLGGFVAASPGSRSRRARHQVGVVAAQVDRRDRAHRPQRRHAAGQAMGRHAHAHATLNDRQQRAPAQPQRGQAAAARPAQQIGGSGVGEVGVGHGGRGKDETAPPLKRMAHHKGAALAPR